MKSSRGITIQKRVIKYSLKFELRTQRGCNRGSVVGTLCFASSRIRFSLGIHHVTPTDWDSARQRLTSKNPSFEKLNQTIHEIAGQVRLYLTTAAEKDADTILAELHSILRLRDLPEREVKENKRVTSWFERFIREHKFAGRPLAKNTLKSYGVVLNSWNAFEVHLRDRIQLSAFSAHTPAEAKQSRGLVERYQRFLIEHGANGKPCNDNSVRKYTKILSTFLRWCENETGVKLIGNLNTRGDIVNKFSISLTREDVSKIEALQLREGSKLSHVRNLILLALNTGLRHSEYHLVKPELWKEPSQLITSPKTGKSCLVIHRPQVRDVLRQYADTGFPSSIKNIQKINSQIKEVCLKAGLTRTVTVVTTVDGVDSQVPKPLYEVVSTHVFRRTKVTLELNEGRSLRDICIETGQDEGVMKKHYDRPNLDEHVRKLGVEKIRELTVKLTIT